MSGSPSRLQTPGHPDITAGLRAPETLVMLLGFATLILLMMAFAAVGMSRMVDVNQRLEDITANASKK